MPKGSWKILKSTKCVTHLIVKIMAKFKVTIRKMVSDTKWKTEDFIEVGNEVSMMVLFHKYVRDQLSKHQGIYAPMYEPVTITASEEGGKVWATFQIR